MTNVAGRTRRIVALVLIGAGLVMGTSSVAMAAEKMLSVPSYKQAKDNWCWAAASKAIIQYKTGKSILQCDIVKDGKNSSTCPNVTGTKGDVRRALSANGVTPGTEVDLSWAQVKAEMSLSRPIYSSIRWRTGGGHAHVIRGYYDTGYSSGVSYMDPATGTRTSRTWTNYQSNDKFTKGTALIYLQKG